ncbi:voltage-dependent anion channel-domain-containing protein [Lactarius quietus]|nr:voltage-dependent anion channel-domain-containing protein [Lactarius quietus]
MIPSYYYEPPSSTASGLRRQEQERACAASVYVRGRTTPSPRLSFTCATEFGEKPILNRREPSSKVPQVSRLARRIHGWSWQAFPVGMGTGSVFVTLSCLKQHPRTLTTVETILFFFNLTFFLLNSSTLLLQLLSVYPQQSRRLINDPIKGVFVPVMVLSFATIIIGTINYGVIPGHLDPEGIYVLFWIYVFLAIVVCFPMLMIWFNKPHDVKTFTPAWAILVPMQMVVSTIASNVLRVIEPSDSRAVGVLFVGYFFQGVGFFMSMFYICIYILRHREQTGFMEGHQANAAFIACGPPGFTALSLITLGSHARKILPLHDLVSPLAGEIWFSSSVLAGILLFGLAVFFFIFGILPYWFKVNKNLSEILGCWALTFPNVGWISTLRYLGDALDIPGFFVVHAVMAVVMCIVWLILFVLTALAFWKGKIFLATEADVLRDRGRIPEGIV